LRSGNLGWQDVPLLAMLAEGLQEEGLNAKPASPEMPARPESKGPARSEDLKPDEYCPLFLDNDANLAALGEYRYGAGRGYDCLVYITVSTGIGGGIIIGGNIYRGAGGSAGEIGHMTVERDGPLCSCGKRGCLEALASGTAIACRARELVAEGRGRGILKYLEKPRKKRGGLCANAGGLQGDGVLKKITAVEVGRAAAGGDSEAKAVLERAGKALGVGMANVVNILNPSLIILGGGVMNIYGLMQDAILFALRENALEVPLAQVQVVPARLGKRAGALGAAALALDSFKR